MIPVRNQIPQRYDMRVFGRLVQPVHGEDIAAVLRKMVKQRQDSIAIYDQAGREDLATQEREELAIVAEFLPKDLDEAAIRAAIAEAITETGAASPKDMGKVIAAVKAKHAGRIDFSKASGLVKDLLAKAGA